MAFVTCKINILHVLDRSNFLNSKDYNKETTWLYGQHKHYFFGKSDEISFQTKYDELKSQVWLLWQMKFYTYSEMLFTKVCYICMTWHYTS